MTPGLIAVGILGRRHGLAGEIALEPLGDFLGLFEPGARFTWKAGERARELKLAARRLQGKRLLLSFEGIADPEAARELGGGVLCVERGRLPKTSPDFYWAHEIQAWRCEDSAGEELGIVGLLEETPAGPQLTLRTRGGKDVLVPFVRPIVLEVDRDRKRVVLDLPEGLMDLQSAVLRVEGEEVSTRGPHPKGPANLEPAALAPLIAVPTLHAD